MDPKKNPQIDVNGKNGLFLNMGLVISLIMVITAFEWKFYDQGEMMDLGQVRNEFEDVIEIPPTEQPPPPSPKIRQPEIIEVPDEEEIEENIDVNLDVEITEETEVEEIIFEEAPQEEVADEIFTVVEYNPEPAGGMEAFYKYLYKHMDYPPQARRMNIEGRVFVEFVIEKDGSITDVKAVKGIGAGCEEEAEQAVRQSPNWKPGKQRGRPVRVRMIIPVTFHLQ